ncbi:Nucleoside-diphosphate-sugar epimerase [Flexibacter flexilis DSM 6793]|uniref:Nucleoside-diphosphate-sugar epimerase n=1 Tax=Flexibacter flexilis DSM 6793 TaxID=927664 RepID=A0A1I1EAN5_9BACT|nr:SDR family NAD(P)-dependent oxidoreductase [Flexibacter flexilis]SFB84194.1 Nucleoside-diphosphate-sugar epimerase [Flexibacter flexilis DSM 6793]
MNVFLTGASGLIGSHIARQLLQKGHQVKALRRHNTSFKLLADIADQIQWVEGDVLDVLPLTEHLQGADVVVHSAAMVSFVPADVEQMNKVNIDGTANLVNICLDTPSVKKLVYISSIAALGRNKNSLIINEETKWENSDDNTNYARSKYYAELEVWRGSEEGLPVAIVNPSIVLGAGDWSSGSTALFKYVYDEKPFYPRGNINYVDVRDVSECVCRLVENNIVNERFVLNAGNVPYKDFLGQIAAQWQKRVPRYEVTPLLAALAWRAEWVKALFTGKKPLITKETARTSSKNYQYDSQKAQQLLGIQFRPLAQTVTEVCQELKKLNN